MKRVVIVGSPGTGKTTFSKDLHNATKLPLVHLDFYHHQLKFDYYTDKPAWIARVKKLIAPDTWIIDGNYNGTIMERCEAADTIIFFDLPRTLCLYRVIKRRVYYRNKHRDDMPSDWEESSGFGFLKYVWQFNKNERPKIVAALDANKDKDIVTFRTSKDALKYLNSFT